MVRESIFPDLSAAAQADDRVFVLIAYNWLCVLLGDAVLDRRLDYVRSYICGHGGCETVAVERAFARSRKYGAFHAIQVEADGGLTVTIRLFRMLTYIIRFRYLPVGEALHHVGVQGLAPPRFIVAERPTG